MINSSVNVKVVVFLVCLYYMKNSIKLYSISICKHLHIEINNYDQ